MINIATHHKKNFAFTFLLNCSNELSNNIHLFLIFFSLCTCLFLILHLKHLPQTIWKACYSRNVMFGTSVTTNHNFKYHFDNWVYNKIVSVIITWSNNLLPLFLLLPVFSIYLFIHLQKNVYGPQTIPDFNSLIILSLITIIIDYMKNHSVETDK